ncbi:putative methyltransferase YcgJ [Lactococcus lactis]|nr:putative methyltransferase YcgJ [Lactococcus lactis]
MLNRKEKIFGSGLDISSEMIKIAQVKHPNFTFKQGSAQKIPFNNESFDLIICSASFHHFPLPELFLIKAECLLRPNGRLVIAEIHIPLSSQNL